MGKLLKDLTDKDVVHVENQKQWDFISKSMKMIWNTGKFSTYGTDSCINYVNRSHGYLKFYSKEGKNIISYNDFIKTNFPELLIINYEIY